MHVGLLLPLDVHVHVHMPAHKDAAAEVGGVHCQDQRRSCFESTWHEHDRHGMQELLGMLRRRRYPEMPLQELEKKKLQCSQFGSQFHIRDMVGRGLLAVLDTPAGRMVQVVKQGR